MISDKVNKIAMIDEVPGLYQINPLVTLALLPREKNWRRVSSVR